MSAWARKTHRGELAERTHRKESFPAGAAVAAYLERELEIIAGIERGAADMRADRVLARADVRTDLNARIERARTGRRKR